MGQSLHDQLRKLLVGDDQQSPHKYWSPPKPEDRKPTLGELRTFNYAPDLEKNVYKPEQLISICSYNVLSEKLKHENSHLYKDPKQQYHTDWTSRWPQVLEQLLQLQADIICLQEVEVDAFEQHFEPILTAGNYGYVFTLRGDGRTDGCVIAYKVSRFSYHGFEQAHFNYGIPNFNQNDVGQVVLLQDTHGHYFVVANYHACEGQDFSTERIGQIMLLLATVDKLKQMCPHERLWGIFLCGTFAFEPSSPLYKLLITGQLNFEQSEAYPTGRRANQAKNSNDKQLFPKSYSVPPNVRIYWKSCTFLHPDIHALHVNVPYLAQPHLFESIYGSYNASDADDKKQVTKFDGTPVVQDYIFYTSKLRSVDWSLFNERLSLLRTFRLPTVAELQTYCGPMPNDQTGSDHLPLYAQFVILDGKSKVSK